jgi:hypothetical protein
MEKLTDDEINQLKTLLIRYFAYHAQGVFNMAVDAVLARFKAGGQMIDITPEPEPIGSIPATAPQNKRKKAVKTGNRGRAF